MNYITSKKFGDISHGFFTKNGGVSSGIYSSLNCALGSNDSKLNVLENKKIIADIIGVDVKNLCVLSQVHSNKIVIVNSPDDCEFVEADAMVTKEKNIAIGILTADCVPVLFADEKAGIIGAAHAGWKGAISAILENTIDKMCELGALRENIIAATGPCIGGKSYEVGVDFYDNFIDKNMDNKQFFIPQNKDKYLFDIRKYVAYRLLNSGISDVDVIKNDTFIEENNFFSYRRSTLRNEADYGRQITVISLG